ncbi:MAG: hypothetical protein ACAH89_11665 [Rariglobus sp.]|nr:hypothetical protein [Rariglobus sp.]
MVRLKKFLLLALAVLGGSLLFTGCTSKTEQDSSIPWSRPASWEGGIPGMGGMGGPGGMR